MKNKLVGAVLCMSSAVAIAVSGAGVANAAGTYLDSDGTYRVGYGEQDLLPGLWSSSGGRTCYWERTASDNSILENSLGNGSQTIEIKPGDATFTTHRCGNWRRAEPVPNPIPGLPPIEAVDYRNMTTFGLGAGIGSAAVGSAAMPSILAILLSVASSGS
ncbi:hypothetical protein [Rhodococcus opacus]|uniref:Secreted protein n=1 Tax=Rhodococcus opacus TaxID=37919 RepID=A0A076EUI7_RHOOP|nr:hypothetical protein [Rhodococcus opacus]AII09471.1 hypothetical protein EP51_34450 [Rhodococcus opacus]